MFAMHNNRLSTASSNPVSLISITGGFCGGSPSIPLTNLHRVEGSTVHYRCRDSLVMKETGQREVFIGCPCPPDTWDDIKLPKCGEHDNLILKY